VPAADRPERVGDVPLDAVFAPFAGLARVALAVSGGADSLALLILAARWRVATPGAPELLVFCVDHGLRPESAEELRFVEAVARRHGLAFRGLQWEGPVPPSGIEAAARSARYRLMVEAARLEGVRHIATAHHRDDQAETFLMRLARGSGVYGLAAMAAETDRGGVRLLRPLLGIPHDALVAIVRKAGLEPVADPHNDDPAFDRVRFRRLLPTLAREGLDPATLADTAMRLGRAAAALDHYVVRLFERAAEADVYGGARLEAEAWADEPEEVRLRALARMLRAVGGAPYVPRLDSVEALAAAMLSDAPFEGRTLAGVVVDCRKGAFRFQREAGRDGLPAIRVGAGYDGIWDGRFHVQLDGPAVAGDVEIGALGPAGRRQLAVCVPRGMPRAIEALPVLRRDGAILACPGLGISADPGLGITFSARAIVAERLRDPARHDDPAT
jgi:tRNA(Ile)-lysidine synthase